MAISSTIMIKAKYRYTLYIGLSTAMAFPVNVSALTFQQSLSLPVSVEHESNPRLSPNNEVSVRRFTLNPRYSLMATQGNDQFSVDLAINAERSSNQAVSADREDPNISLGWTRGYETGQFGITANFSEQSTRTSEFDETGLVTNNNTRQTHSVGADWRKELSERYSLTVGLNATKVEFDGQTASLNDYDNKSINTQLAYSINDQIESFVGVSFSRFEPTSSDVSNFRSLEVGGTWEMSEQLSINGSVGINKTSGASNESGSQAMFGTKYTTARTQSNVSLSRSRSPSSSGIINESNRLSAGWSYSLSEIENLAVDFNWQENLTADLNKTRRVSANYTRAISPSWDFRLMAQHRNRDDATSDASSNSLTATLIYNLPDF